MGDKTLRRFVLVLAIAISAPMASNAGAQSRASLGLAAGATVPMSSYGNDKDVGYHLGLVLDLRTVAAPLAFRIDGMFNELGYSGSSTKEQIWMANGNVVVRVPTGSSITPYLIGGAGVYNRRRTLAFGNNASTTLGLNAGVGLRFGLGESHTFVEARYHVAGSDNDVRIVPLSFGVSF
jgi:hypothetical protein